MRRVFPASRRDSGEALVNMVMVNRRRCLKDGILEIGGNDSNGYGD